MKGFFIGKKIFVETGRSCSPGQGATVYVRELDGDLMLALFFKDKDCETLSAHRKVTSTFQFESIP